MADQTLNEAKYSRDSQYSSAQAADFRVKALPLSLPPEWTSGSVSELLDLLAVQEYLSKQEATPSERQSPIHSAFVASVQSVHGKYLELIGLKPLDRSAIPRDRKLSGVYLFSEGEEHQYVGRTSNLRKRLSNHDRPSSAHNQAVFAFKLARHATGNLKACYSGEKTRKGLLELPEFAELFFACKARVRRMDLRFVEETDPLRQALLEIYAATCLKTPFNDFANH